MLGWVGRAFPTESSADATTTHGAFHGVVLGDTVVARVLDGPEHGDRARREHRTWRAWGDLALPVPVPQVLSEVRSDDVRSGYLVERLPGVPDDGAPWPAVRSTWADLLAALADIDTTGLDLPPARMWCGGESFDRIVAEDLAPLLDHEGGADVAAAAVGAVHRALALEPVGPLCLVHGDLGPHNLLRDGAATTGLIDLDHACVADPVLDLAPLLGRYGRAAVREIAEPEQVERAGIYRATLSLQVAAAAHLRGATSLRDHALGNFAARVRAGTLDDPDGGPFTRS